MPPIEQHMRETCERYGVGSVYVFGSRAKEIAARVRGQEARAEFPNSDVDIAVQTASGKRLTAQERVRFAIELEDVLDVECVDLVVLSEADPFLALGIIRGELLYCLDADAQAEEELYVLRRAGDLARHARIRREQILTGEAR